MRSIVVPPHRSRVAVILVLVLSLALTVVWAGCAPGRASGVAVTFAVGKTDATGILVYDTATGEQREHPLEAGSNTVSISANSTSVIGFIHDPVAVDSNHASTRQTRAQARSLGNAVSLVGTISVVADEIDSLPVADDAEQDVDLGTLTQDGGTFSSDADVAGVAGGIGRDGEVLDGYWDVDQSLLKELNPDVNQNGVRDADEGFSWELIADFWLSVDAVSLLDAADGTIFDPEWITQDEMILYWRSNDRVDASSWDEIFMEVPSNYSITADGEPVTRVRPQEFTAGIPGANESFNFDIGFTRTGSDHLGWDPPPPYEGEYGITIGSRSYLVSKVEFFRPESGFAGIPIQLIRLTKDAEGTYTRVDGRFVMIDDGIVRDATQDELSLIVTRASVDFGPTEKDFPTISIEHSLDSSRFSIDLTEYGMDDGTYFVYGPTMHDFAGNQYQVYPAEGFGTWPVVVE